MRLAGRTALVTGAGAGIGRACALMFAREGASVLVAEINGDAGEDTAELIRSGGGRAAFVRTDVGEPEQVEEAVRRAVADFGGLHVLYNNAGGSTAADGPVTTAPLEEFWNKMRVDLFGMWLGCRYAVPAMREAGGGSIVNATSMCALIGTPGRDAYTAAKGAIVSLTRSMAVEFAADSIRVNAVAPGATTTERVLSRMSKGGYSSTLADRHLLGYPDPDDVAMTVLHLASDESRRTTGQILVVDGGLTIT